jgi:hypothetical protein
MEWSPRSLELKLMYCFFWGFAKDNINVHLLLMTLEELKTWISQICGKTGCIWQKVRPEIEY